MPMAIVILASACSNTSKVENNNYVNKQYPEKGSDAWCQKNYSGASVGHQSRQSNAKYCDTGSRLAFEDAQEKKFNRDYREKKRNIDKSYF